MGTIGDNSKYDEVSQAHQGVQGQVSVLQVPLLGHGSEIETPNWAIVQRLGPDQLGEVQDPFMTFSAPS